MSFGLVPHALLARSSVVIAQEVGHVNVLDLKWSCECTRFKMALQNCGHTIDLTL